MGPAFCENCRDTQVDRRPLTIRHAYCSELIRSGLYIRLLMNPRIDRMPRSCTRTIQDEVRPQQHKATPLVAFGDVSFGCYFIRKPTQPSTRNEHPRRSPATVSSPTALVQRAGTRVLASVARRKAPKMAEAAVRWDNCDTTGQCCRSVKPGNVTGPHLPV